MVYRELLNSLEKICVLVAITYFATRTETFVRLLTQVPKAKDKLFAFGFFGLLCLAEVILSTVGSPLDARIISATAAGLMAGPLVGIGIGILTGAISALVSGPASAINGVPATIGGALGGWVFAYGSAYRPKIAAGFLAGALSHGAWLGMRFRKDFLVESWDVLAMEHVLPMFLTGAGVALFLIIIGDIRAQRERIERSELARAIGLANRTQPKLGVGLDESVARHIADTVRLLAGLPAAQITSTDRVLAHVGEGSDHHGTGDSLPEIAELSMRSGERQATDKRGRFCSRDTCSLACVAAAPLSYDGQIIGSTLLFETRGARIKPEAAELGAEIAQFLTNYQMQMAEIEAQAQAISRAELKALQAQVHPHFLFNALNTLAGLCEFDPRKAAELTVKLGEFFRSSFESEGDFLSSLQEELAVTRSYLDIERARFGDRLEVMEEVEPEALRCRLPSFTLQPLVENAVLHGLSAKAGRGRLRITVRLKGDRLVCWVCDDGRGFDASALKWRENTGHALAMLANRLDSIYSGTFGLRVRSRPDRGTTVCLWVPTTEESR